MQWRIGLKAKAAQAINKLDALHRERLLADWAGVTTSRIWQIDGKARILYIQIIKISPGKFLVRVGEVCSIDGGLLKRIHPVVYPSYDRCP